MKKGIFVVLNTFCLFIVLSLFSLQANAAFWDDFVDFFTPTPPPTYAPPAPSPSTPSTTIRNIDSRLVVPPGTAARPGTARSPSVQVPTPALLSQTDLTALLNTPCPENPICPNINGIYPAGGSASTCPETCTVTRADTTATLPSGVTKVTSSSPAVCPLGYTATAVFNAGREIVSRPAWSEADAAPYPIATVTQYNAYLANGYNCKEIASSGTKSDAVQSCGNQYIPPAAPTIIEQFGGVGRYTRSWNGGCFELTPACTNAKPCGSLVNDMLYLYDYVRYKCYPPAGLYYSSNTTPISVVCSVVKAVWQ